MGNEQEGNERVGGGNGWRYYCQWKWNKLEWWERFFWCGGDDGDGNDDFLVIFFLCAIEYHGIKPINHDGYSSEKTP